MAPTSIINKLLLGTGIGLWLAAAAWGTKLLTEYSFQPALVGHPSERWPAGTAPLPGDLLPTFVMGLHPGCPCSRASVAELGALLGDTSGMMRTILVFIDNDPDSPAKDSDLYRSAQQLQGVTLLLDRDESIFKTFDLVTSGEARVYRADGALLFAGGITGSRGHLGANPGRTAALAAARTPSTEASPAVVRMPVFGCAAIMEESR